MGLIIKTNSQQSQTKWNVCWWELQLTAFDAASLQGCERRLGWPPSGAQAPSHHPGQPRLTFPLQVLQHKSWSADTEGSAPPHSRLREGKRPFFFKLRKIEEVRQTMWWVSHSELLQTHPLCPVLWMLFGTAPATPFGGEALWVSSGTSSRCVLLSLQNMRNGACLVHRKKRKKKGRNLCSPTGRQTCKTSTKEKENFFFFHYINRTQILEEQKADYMCNASICTLHRNCSFFFLPLVLSSVNTANHKICI